jgi:hypothetical protein
MQHFSNDRLFLKTIILIQKKFGKSFLKSYEVFCIGLYIICLYVLKGCESFTQGYGDRNKLGQAEQFTERCSKQNLCKTCPIL